MLIDFFYTLRAAKLPVSVREYLNVLEALQANVVGPASDSCSIDDFYHLSRTVMVKDEKHYDKFDKAFGAYFKGVEMLTDFTKEVPLEWLQKVLEKELTPEQIAAIEKMGWDELMETLKKRLEEQKERHEGGNKWIGTGGTSPFGNGGQNPQGIRIGGKGGQRSAVKVWEQRAYRDYDILDTYEAGMVLTGSEVKSLREGNAQIAEGYARVQRGEMWIDGIHIPPYTNAIGFGAHDPDRERKLLLNRAEIDKLDMRTAQGGLTIVPLRLYWKNGRAKIELGLAKGRTKGDKRQHMAERDADREMQTEFNRANKYGDGHH